ncbi:MAG: hypothetical protein M0R17_11015 [Candidatus Omnitrophica bacterium]|jgi:hypothetical protein|nr:hypothetical protein [Candidatus Omnitrophota bacterium]
MRVNYYECKICKGLVDRGVKGIKRFRGTRKDVIKHLHDEHHLKHIKNSQGKPKKDFGQSSITLNTLVVEIK